ncbi:MAG: OmpA family protein [Bacteroidia bacterium]|nr:OmpA family protein [Bacteroidia bacterium]
MHHYFKFTIRIFILAFFTTGMCWAQDHVLLMDEFIKARPHWKVRQGKYTLEEGWMSMIESDLTRRNVHAIEQYLNNAEDFSISTSIIPQKSMGAASYGIVFGGNEDLSSYYAFEINAEGFARIMDVQNGKEKVYRSWAKNRKIKGIGEEHQLTLQKIGKGLYFRVNEKELFRIDLPPIYGFFQGLTSYGSCEIKIDYYEIVHPPVRFLQLGGTWPDAVRLHLDTTVNTSMDETHPLGDPRRARFYFSREENIYETHLSDSGWVAGMPLEPGFNNVKFNRISSFSEGGNKMILGNDYGENAQKLGFSIREKDNWGKITQLSSPPIIPETDTPIDWFLSKDEKTLLFSADLPGGYGNTDIYACFWEEDSWSKPVNLGPAINTFAEEYSPYLKEDGKTLFFGSNGKAGYGGGDLYKSSRQSNTWRKWSYPENLGGGINSPGWDRDFFPHPMELRTYYMASQDSFGGNYDIYKVKIPFDLEAQPVLKVFGDVYLEGTDTELEAHVQAWRIGAGIAKEAEADTEYGRYGMLLELGQAYQIYALKLGYYPIIDTIDARAFSSYREIRKDLYLKKLEPGVIVTLQQLFFVRGKAELLPESYPELNRLLQLMQTRPRLKIEIHGHTDNIGSPNQLKRLSEQRAARVMEYLINNRISPGRLSSKGFGADRPIAPNENPITRALNRRVEFLILSQ